MLSQNKPNCPSVLGAKSDKSVMNIHSILSQCDELIRNGSSEKVHALISQIDKSSLDRNEFLPLAKICRRAGMISEGLRFLAPFSDIEKNRWRDAMTTHERAEYGVLLLKNGSRQDAIKLFSKISPSIVPDVLLNRAFCYMAEWDYDQAEHEIRKYLELDLEPYSKLIADVNLVAALINNEHWTEALEKINYLIEQLAKSERRRLLGNCLELRSQIYLKMENYTGCESDLDQCRQIFKEDESTDQLFVLKWQAYLQAKKEQSTEALVKFRAVAQKRGHWESIRETDRLALLVSADTRTLNYLVFGTPFEKYLKKIFNHFQGHAAIKDLGENPFYTYLSGLGPTQQCLHLATGRMQTDRVTDPLFRLDDEILQLVSALTFDFYRPQSVAEIFYKLYPEEHFNIFTSPNRVHQVISRTRRKLKTLLLPMEVIEGIGGYRILTHSGFGIQVELFRHFRVDTILASVRMAFGDQYFTVTEAAEKLNLTQTQIRRWLKEALEENAVTKLFGGSATCYLVNRRSAA